MAALSAGLVPAAYFAIFSLTLAGSPKTAVSIRLGAAIAMAGLLRVFCVTQVWNINSPGQRAPLLTMLWVSYMSAAEFLVLSRIDAADLSDLSKKKSGSQSLGFASLCWNALCLYFNFRRSATRWAIRNIPRRKPESATRFVATRLPLWIAGYLILNLFDLGPLPEAHLVAEEKQTLLYIWKLSGEDVVFRLVSCVMFWFATFLLIWMVYYLGAIVTVILGLSSPADWPPLFGPCRSASTLSGFWGTFWHQSLRATLVSWADAVLDILGMRRHTLTRRYTRILLVFVESGVLHHLTDVAMGLGHGQLAATTFFFLQPLGVFAETLVQNATASIRIPTRVQKCIGFVWVLTFLWWSTAVLFYPSARLGFVGKISPYSVL